MISIWIFAILTLLMRISNGETRTCDSSDSLGYSDLFSVSGVIGLSSDTQFVMTDSEYISPCCGLLTEWQVYATTTGTLVFQVWRPNSGITAAELIGENIVNVTSTSEFTYSVPTADQIEIQEDDVIGWYSGDNEIVEFVFGLGENANNFIEDIAQPSVGDTENLNTQVTYRTFAIYARLGDIAIPTLTNLDDTVSASTTSVDTVTPVFTVTSSSTPATFTLDSISPSSHFGISNSTGEVIATTTSLSSTTYTLTISVSNTCSNSSTGTLTIVLIDTTPVWSNLDATVSVSKNSMSTTTASYTVLATIASYNDSVSYSIQSITPSSDFTVDAISGDVTALSTNVSEYAYTLVIRASHADGNYVDGTLTIAIVNTSPEIISLPNVAYVSEAAVDETLLHTVNVTDADGDQITCEMTSSPSGPFLTKYMTVNNLLATGLYLQGDPNLNYTTTNTYTLSVTCTDGSASDTDILYVYVTQNNVPQITNLPNSTSIVSSTLVSTEIFQVISFDAENDGTYFSLSCLVTSSPCPFTIYSDGSVLLTSSLTSTSNLTYAYELDISIRDDFSTSGVHRLTVFLTDLNTTPELNNLPETIQLTEDTSVGSAIFDTSVYDEDGDTTHTFTAFYTPASSAALFQLNSTSGEITLTTSLNYQTHGNITYTIDLRVSDGQTWSSTETLTIRVVDANEPPVLYQTNYQVEVEEGPAGTKAPDPGFNVHDPDSDTLIYSFGGGNDTGKFSINTSNGIVSFSTAIDADDESIETFYVWLIVISDPEGLSATATLTLSILDANDNVPYLSSSNYAAVVSNTDSLGTSVLQVQSFDNDQTDENKELSYTIHNTNLFKIDHNGTIYISSHLTDFLDTIQTFSIRVKNTGVISTYDSAGISVAVRKNEQEDDDFFDNGANIAWVTLVCIFGPLVIAGVAYLCYVAYQKWVSSSVITKSLVTQVAPYDTKMSTISFNSQRSRASLLSRDTVASPRDVKIMNGNGNRSWEGWGVNDWAMQA